MNVFSSTITRVIDMCIPRSLGNKYPLEMVVIFGTRFDQTMMSASFF